jgi:hypothetical protein
MKTYFPSIKKLAAFTALTAVVVSSFGSALIQPSAVAYAEGTAKVTILKYIDNAPATAITASSSSFQMNADYTIASTTGSGQYALSAAGYNGNPTPYQAVTSDLPVGSNYATNEIIDNITVGSVNSSSTPFSLFGYTYGETLAEAAAATPAMTSPAFTNLTTDKFVIVWNKSYTAPIIIPPVSTSTPSTVKVTIEKFVNGAQATASTSNNESFPMTATYNSTTTGAGTGTYSLSPNGYNGDPTPYQAKTIDMESGADYATNEVLDGAVVGSSCSTTQPFALVGYSTGNTLAEAMVAPQSTSTPSFTNMTSDKFVIVWNKTCSSSNGTIGGDVTGGTSTSTQGVLKVDSITAVKTTATADGTFTNGWKYVFNITVPNDETHLSMKFADWMSTVGSTTMAAANNMRISSLQADNAGATVLVTAANVYTTPTLNMISDLDSVNVGKQVQVTVEVAVPSSTVNGAYSTSYGVKTI